VNGYQKSYLVCDELDNIIGVFNVSEIVRGAFQNAFLGFYGLTDYTGKGYMSAGLKLVQKKVFEELELHRLEANIQPENTRSIQLVKTNGFRYEGFSPRYLKINGEWRGHEHWAITAEDYIADSPSVLKKDHVNIVPYNSEWPFIAQTEIEKIKSVFPADAIIDIQHVGSTAQKEWGWLETLPVIRMRKVENRRIRWLTQNEASQLLKELPSHLKDMASFTLVTGLRESNVTQLKWSEIHLEKKHALIHADESKSKRPIPVPLSQQAIAILKDQIGKNPTYVFT
jgi:hypothetical protein